MPTLGDYQDVVQINLENFRYAVVNSDHSITLGGGAKMVDLVPTLHKAGREMSMLIAIIHLCCLTYLTKFRKPLDRSPALVFMV